jgi:phage terminase small subunit
MSDKQETKAELEPLRAAHRVFVHEYMRDFNGTRAYRMAYPRASEHTARVNASRLLAIANISAYVKALIDEKLMSVDEAMIGIADIARGDIGDLLDNNGLLDIRAAKEKGLTKLLRKIKQKTIMHIGKSDDDDDTEITEIEFEMYDAHAAKRDILKMHGKFSERVALTGADGGAIEVNYSDAILRKLLTPDDDASADK